ncbi:serine--tRNA ligase [Azospirillum brasilense]|uniref:Serine--tRNA ligase n=1 Tax=Azospirillum brasilense TaxID=192 RepID=A0A0P0EGZ0_AZOBR|nr:MULTISPECIES: serine--tRNA ligase [Azospirillum]ALJ37164.1 serine--tRNA ligase [Azospirillum brasilense]MDW7551865.1 serine--tRNA ligase [Azospirillum brasilense]MDW7591300.1 serine--tRNA ligase [Azospirillum brasilense]MDW7626470.1 serine--tRNA ligase [Azospirillum brasilense]MDX5951181.1 serine--tRNA ligase [Azospirillum brasilense]
MHDLRAIRENPESFDRGLARRGLEAMSPTVLDLDSRRRAAQTQLQEMQARRNEAAKEIGLAKREGRDAQPLMDEMAQLKERLPQVEEEEKALGAELDGLLASIPNLPADDVPEGPDESANVEIRRWGEPKAIAGAKQHFELGEALGLMDFEAASRMSGARFTVLKGGLARLERALADFMLDIHTGEHGYTEIAPPLMVRDNALFGTGQLPKFEEDLFRTGDHYLIPTSEVPLTNLVNDQIVATEELPHRYTALTPCFRAEAGSAGRDTRGMIRQHQFWKVEMVSVTAPDQSEAEHQRMTQCAETILQRLGLPYRVVTLCTGDMGFSARKTFDIEVWLPGQNMYREISSCSNCGDFQARRMKARCRPKGEKQTQFVHTLNGSGVAVGRCLIAVLENYQQPDGSILVPEALRPYMRGLERITA